MTLAASAATAERDQALGPEEAKRAAAVRSYCSKIGVMTRPELKKEVEKYKNRRLQVLFNLFIIGSPTTVKFHLNFVPFIVNDRLTYISI